MARAYHAEGQTVYGFDIREETMKAALEEKVLDGVLNETTVQECDLRAYVELFSKNLNSFCPIIDDTPQSAVGLVTYEEDGVC